MTIATTIAHALAPYGRRGAEAFAEALWPTRCAVCDEPGTVLCTRCRMQLPYIDRWRACPRCGAPFGHVQCTECNDVMLASAGRSAPAFDGMASAVTLDAAASRIVRTWKDASERRLARHMACIMSPYIEPTWAALSPVVVPIPASTAARVRRGFDHDLELARAVAQQRGLPCAAALAHPTARDQRTLARRGRIENMQGRFRVLPGATPPQVALLVDDVCTTGSTISAAADALRAAGTETVFALTFARAW